MNVSIFELLFDLYYRFLNEDRSLTQVIRGRYDQQHFDHKILAVYLICQRSIKNSHKSSLTYAVPTVNLDLFVMIFNNLKYQFF